MVSPLIIDGQSDDSIWVFPSTSREDLLFESKTLLESFQGRISPDLIRKIERLVVNETLNAKVLEPFGIRLHLREETLEAVLEIDPSVRLPGFASVAGDPLRGAKRVSNEDWSGYINALATESFNYGSHQVTHPTAFDGALLGTFQVKTWVLETGVNYADTVSHRWTRQDTRLIFEERKAAWRFEAGDIHPQTVGFQTSKAIGGMSLNNSQNAKTSRAYRPLRDQTIFLQRPSRIEVLINGFYFTTLTAPAGIFQLRDLPVSGALTNVDLVITDDLGRKEKLSTSILFDQDVLAEGEEEFSFSAGSPYRQIEGDRAYDSDLLLTSGSYRLGLPYNNVFGFDFQGQEGRVLYGLSGMHLFKRGVLGLEFGLLQDDKGGSHGSSRLRFRSRSVETLEPSWSYFFSAQHRGGNRATVLRDDFGISYPISYDFGLSRPLGARSNFTASWREEIPRDEDRSHRQVLFADIDRSFTSDLLGRLSWQQVWESDTNYTVMFSLIWTESASRQVSLSYEHPNQSTQASLSYTPIHPVRSTSANARISHAPEQSGASVQAKYTGVRFNAGFDHQGSWYDNRDDQTTRINAETALVWAGRQFAVSRPMSGSFAIVKGPSNLDGVLLAVNHAASAGYSEITPMWPAVVPGMSDFSNHAVFVDQTHLPEGYSLRHYQYFVETGYRTGALIELEGEGTAMVVTTLLGANGKPISLKSGEVVSLKDSAATPVVFFTNTEGRTVVEGLREGEYELRFFDESLAPVKIEVPKNSRGLLHLPPITVTR